MFPLLPERYGLSNQMSSMLKIVHIFNIKLNIIKSLCLLYVFLLKAKMRNNTKWKSYGLLVHMHYYIPQQTQKKRKCMLQYKKTWLSKF